MYWTPRRIIRVALTLACLALASLLAVRANKAPAWKTLSPGMDLSYLATSAGGEARIAVLRIDPASWELEFIGATAAAEGQNRTAREWSSRRKFSAAINAGMYKTDLKTHVGYLRYGEHTNNGKSNAYQSVAAFGPRDSSMHPAFRIFDLDAPGAAFQDIVRDYSSVTQNLRLIKRPGSNQWNQQDRKWSEAALGEDQTGRVLFIFSRAAFTMHDFNQELLGGGIDLVAAQHLEGGPEAQLYIHAGDVELEMFGSYETSFTPDDSNSAAWPIPNVLGVRPKTEKAK